MFRLNKYFYNKTNKIKNFDFFNRFNLLTMKILVLNNIIKSI